MEPKASHRLASKGLRHTHGFTLVELLVVLAIVSVIVVLATPSYDGVMVESRLDQERLRLATGLAFARSEAIERGNSVRMCAHANNGCIGSDAYIAAGFEWLAGWRVEVATTGELLRKAEKQTTGLKITYDCGALLVYGGSSERTSTPARDEECTFTISDPSYPSITKSLAVSKTGRVRMF